MADILKKIGDKASGVVSTLKSLPPGDSEAQGIKAASDQIDALKAQSNTTQAAPASTVPAPTEEEKANPLTRYGAKPGEKRLDTSYLDQPTAVKAPVYDRGGEVGIIGGTNNNARSMPTMRLPAYDNGGDVRTTGGMRVINWNKAPSEPADTSKLPTEKEGSADWKTDQIEHGSPSTPEYKRAYDTGRGNETLERPSTDQSSVGHFKLVHPELFRPVAPQPPIPEELRTSPVYDNGGDVKVLPEDHKMTVQAGPDKPEDYLSRYGSEAAVANRPEVAKPSVGMKPIPLYDEGTPEVDVNDGKHQVAILKDGESVLTPEETEQRKAEQASKVEAPSPALKTQDAKSTDEGQPLAPTAEATPKAKPFGQLVEEKATEKAGEAAAAQPKAAIAPEEKKPEITGGHILADQWLKKNGMPSMVLPPEGNPVLPTYGGPGKPVAQGEAISAKQLPQDELKYQIANLNQQHTAALAERTPEGQEKADRIALQIQDLQKSNPWGSAANHPGVLGRLGHVAEMVASRAPGLAPIMATLPGSEGYRAGEQASTKANLEKNTALTTAREAEENKAGETAKPLTNPESVYKDLTTGDNGKPRINPETNAPWTPQEANVASQGTGKTPEELYIQEQMRGIDPGTGKHFTRAQAEERYLQTKAGTKPPNEEEKRVNDYIGSRGLQDTPANREAARTALKTSDTTATQQAALPFAEQKSKFNDSLATTRALLVQQNADANQRGLKSDELQNTENTRSTGVLTKITTAKDALNATDEQFANQIVPIVTLLSVTSAEGVKRVNKQELDKFVPTSGSLGRWVEGHADQFLSGQIPPEYRTEVGHMLDRMEAAEDVEHKINSQSIDQTIRQGAQQPVQKPTGGATATPAKSKPQAPAAIPAGVPKGTTIVYRDKSGAVVGYAEGGKYKSLSETK
jgi:hypothetical protein